MNYRHAYHAGNFADLLKHAALTLCLEAMTRDDRSLTVMDTHAGAGAYDLSGVEALKSGEAAIARLLADESAPEAFDALAAAVSRINGGETGPIYPGSPALICAALRANDRFIACELRSEEHGLLAGLLEPLAPQASALQADGFATAVAQTPGSRDVLVLIDPPYEKGDDYQRIVSTCAGVMSCNAAAVILIWAPLKDLETFDGFLRGLEGINPPPTLVVEARLRPLLDPMAMNGCALVVLNPPVGIEDPLRAACDWIAHTLGSKGGEGRVWKL